MKQMILTIDINDRSIKTVTVKFHLFKKIEDRLYFRKRNGRYKRAKLTSRGE
jgi:hypothetical protein